MQPALLGVVVAAALALSHGAQARNVASQDGTVAPSAQQPRAVSLQPSGRVIMNLRQIAAPAGSTIDLVGQEVALRDVCVARVSEVGFWISAPGARREVFVIPAEGPLITAQAGSTVSLWGEVRQITDAMRAATDAPYAEDDLLYLYGYVVRPAWPTPSTRSSPGACPR